MASLVCPDCGTAVPWKAAGCAGCGAPFREILCAGCKYVGVPERFDKRQCPRCSKDELQIVPCNGEELDEVGDEAFINDVPLADDIERSFARDREKRPSTPSAGHPASNPAKPPAAKSPQDQEARRTDRAASERKPPTDTKPKPRTPDDRSSERRREKPKAPVKREKDDEPRSDRREREPPAVLKRRSWTTPKDDEDGDEKEPAPEESPVRSTKQEPVADRKRKGISFELSQKARQILQWAVMGVPVLLLVFAVFYFFGSGRKPKIRHGTEMTVDAGALEAQAAALYDAAAQYYRSGQIEQALMTLQQIVSQFPLTSASGQARAALNRSAQGQPLFEGLVAQPSPEQLPPSTRATPAAPPAEKKNLFVGIPTTPAASGQPSPPDSPDENLIAGAAPKLPGAPRQGSTLAKSDAKPRQLPPGFEAVEAAGVHSSGWPIEIVCLRDSSHMMLVPAGEFEMGNNGGEPNAKPIHRVKLKAYYIDKFEITLLQYKHFLEQRRLEKSPYRELSQAALAAASSDRHPVVGVAWRDANAYAEWSGKNLPTEAQWEKAARGTDGRLSPWGSGPPTWEKPREPKQLDRVGSFAWDVSVYGCYDMAGNAWEWCADWYDQNFYHSSPTEDPDGPKTAPTPVVFKDPEKVIRAGSAAWEAIWRGFSGIQEEPLHVGFRCVLDVERLAPRATVAAPSSSPPPSGRIPATAPKIPPGGYKF